MKFVTGLWFLIFVLFVGAIPDSAQQTLSDDTNNEHHEFPRLNFSSPSPLIFHSTFSLLQQWPNTFFPNGHTIAPCSVPKNTRLYHARTDAQLPPSPEWVAFDPEMSYAIAGNTKTSHMVTYRTTTEFRCLYFDGQSAALMLEGFLDSQMVFLYNNSASVPEEPIFGPMPDEDCWPDSPAYNSTKNCTFPLLQREYERAEGFCDFIHDKDLGGPGWGYEGIVRMNAGFEMIVCNFSSPSLALISNINVSTPELEGVSRPSWPPGSVRNSGFAGQHSSPLEVRQANYSYPIEPITQPFTYDSWARWYTAAAKRYGFAGGKPGRPEARVRIDSCNLFSFYDPLLVDQERSRVIDESRKMNISIIDGVWTPPRNSAEVSGALQKLSRRRRHQRAQNVSVADGVAMGKAVEQRMRASLQSDTSKRSGTDWVWVAQEIVAANSNGLYELFTTLSDLVNSTSREDMRGKLVRVRDVTHAFVMPFYAYPPWTKENAATAFALTRPESVAAMSLCIGQVADMETGTAEAERTTHLAISDTQAAICQTVVPLFLGLEVYWLVHYNNVSAPPPPRHVQDAILEAATHWLHAIKLLVAWLGWSEQWTACEPGCSLGEVCATYMWPVGDLQPFLFEDVDALWEMPGQDKIERFLERAVFNPVCARPDRFTESWERLVQKGRVN